MLLCGWHNFFQKSITLKFPRWNVFAGGDVGALKLDFVLPSRGDGDVVGLIQNTQVSFLWGLKKEWSHTSRRGNSSACPKCIWNPASTENTDPSLTLMLSFTLGWVKLSRKDFLHSYFKFLPVHVPVDDDHQPLICSRSSFLNFWMNKGARFVLKKWFCFPAFACEGFNMLVGHLHLFHKTTVLRIHKVHLKVEGTADSGVSDDGGEDLRAVHLRIGFRSY